MAVEQEIHKLFKELLTEHFATIAVGGSQVFAKIQKGDELVLSTPIFIGGDYIPSKVRECIKKHPPFFSHIIEASPILSEEKFEITLVYKGNLQSLDFEKMKIVLEEFGWLGDEWRSLLDEQDRNDRVEVYVR